MSVTFNEKFLAYLALFSGLVISVVAEYYSILGLTAIFAAAVIPVVIMGIALGVGKITATLWLKQNWTIAPWTIRLYLASAIAVLMLITSMGIFGFLSKAHSDQSLVSGDVQSKIAIYDEKIKTAKENIESDRRQLKQMDEAVDQVMARSTDEKGADKSNAIRRAQQRDRTALAKDIEANQKLISSLNDEAAPIRAEVRKVEAEVGPVKYIAAFVYGDTDQTVLEKAVTWVIIILIVVFDPLAVILLLASQISFQNFRERVKQEVVEWTEDDFEEIIDDPWVADVGEKPTAEELAEIDAEGDSPEKESDVISTATVTEHHPDTHPYLTQGFKYPENYERIGPLVATPDTPVDTENKEPVRTVITGNRSTPKTRIFKTPPQTLTTVTEDIVQAQLEEVPQHTVTHMGNGYVQVDGQMYHEGSIPPEIQGYIQNEEQRESGVWSRVKKDEE
jgi:Skp family chaperone for outer membrane proteins